MAHPSVRLVISAVLLAAIALSATAGANGAPTTDHLLVKQAEVKGAADDLAGTEALPGEALGDDGPSALDKVGALLAAAGGAVADVGLAVIGAIGDGLAAVGHGLVALITAVGSGLATVGSGVWAAIVWTGALAWTGLIGVGHGVAIAARFSWDGLSWLAIGAGKGVVAGTVFIGGAFADLGGLLAGLAGRLVEAWPSDPRQQAIVATSAAAGTAAAGGAAWYTRPWRALRYLPFLAPLYARITKEELLDHPVRQGLHAAIAATPGIHVSELARVEDLPWGTLLHHLDKLEKAGLVVSSSEAGKRCFFLPGQVPREQRSMLPALENAKARSLAEYFAANPGATQKDAGRALGLSAALVSWHIKRLEKAGVLTRTRVGRTQQVGLTGEAKAVVVA